MLLEQLENTVEFIMVHILYALNELSLQYLNFKCLGYNPSVFLK